MELLAIRLEGKIEEVQCIQVLAPSSYLPLNPSACGPHRFLRVGYGDEKFPLEETILLEIWDILGSKD